MKIPVYEYDLGNNRSLKAYSIDPSIDESCLEDLVCSLDGKSEFDKDKISKYSPCVATLDSIDDLEIKIVEERYKIPEQLKSFRKAIEKKSDDEGKYNGECILINSRFNIPLEVIAGGYYDFLATLPNEVPSELVPGEYPEGKTILQLFKEWGLKEEDRAKYLGFGHLLLVEKGKDLMLVHRAKKVLNLQNV